MPKFLHPTFSIEPKATKVLVRRADKGNPSPVKYLVVSTSGNPDSNSRRMGRIAFDYLQKAKVPCEFLDISELGLPLCDADTCYTQPAAQQLNKAVEAADGILIATPVYNYDVSAATKNMVELTGTSWEDKVVGFLCAAGGMNSYMSVMAFANSLMLDFRSVIIPRFVYATGGAFEGDDLKDDKIAQRINEVAAELIRFTQALRG
ncbi:MAG: flavoprotein [Chthoniobacterales bacterium]|nr:MAG: flavoprotein [Chthoniobacterales bacterium]